MAFYNDPEANSAESLYDLLKQLETRVKNLETDLDAHSTLIIVMARRLSHLETQPSKTSHETQQHT